MLAHVYIRKGIVPNDSKAGLSGMIRKAIADNVGGDETEVSIILHDVDDVNLPKFTGDLVIEVS